MRNAHKILALITLLSVAGCATNKPVAQYPPDAPVGPAHGQLFKDMGTYHRPVTTRSLEAQAYIDQGMTWLQAFNHDEATASFRGAARLDPDCAMAWWGIAYSEGPNYNDPVMTKAREQSSYDAVQEALARIDNASPVERDLINALATRYEKPFSLDRKRLDEAYANAMGEVWKKYPDDAQIGALYAESRMVLRPWQLYTPEREPTGDTQHIVATLERVLELDPNHAGACHLYIHAVEQSKSPDRAIPAANRLSKLVPASGHLRHMPSHIYIRTNMWDRSIEQNALAMLADEAYRRRSPNQYIQHMYMVHNNHVLAYSAMMVGREREAMSAARKMWTDIPEDQFNTVAPFVDRWMCSVYDVQKRFGRWDDLLAEPAPPEYMPITRAYWRAHRAVAFAAKKDFESAELERQAFESIRDNFPPERLPPGETIEAIQRRLEAIRHFIPGEIALQRGDLDEAIQHLVESVEAEDKLGFGGEPPDYLQPIRHTLGAVLVQSGKYDWAEKVYRRDLEEYPGNGWSLYGLSRALHGQGNIEEARKVEAQLLKAWSRADEPLSTSCKCIPRI